ncbi:ABC transporter permease [uncultured Anaerococcus sp.]|uniref:ABC transporter permease n=1 Tax=uncultured Anaerococcus sp. TaxID=293428 RepID=UPI00261A7336|nr:ABC transporter permease [uncultured Anaerococcus sp.]
MAKKVIKQLVYFISLLIFVTFVSFLLMDISPIDPVSAFARSRGGGITPKIREKLIKEWGLDLPFIKRYLIWISHLLRGNLGISNIYGRPVIEIIKKGFKSSIMLMIFAWIIQGIFGLFLGIVAGSNPGSIRDKSIKLYAIVMASTPQFWLGMLMIIIFSIKLRILPASMGSPIGMIEKDISFADKFYHMLLPGISLALVGISNIALHTRQKAIDIMNSDYVLYAYSRGIKKKRIVNSFALKNMILPGLTIQFTYFSELFSGAILAENVFNYPGLGNLTVQAGLRGDVPLLLGLVLFSMIFVYVGNRLCDLMYLILDPRTRKQNED